MHPFYNPNISYDENYRTGPFGDFRLKRPGSKIPLNKFKFLNFELNSPFGIPAGPVINANFVKAAFDWGYDLVTYKTVRSAIFPCHPWPNIIPLKIKNNIGITNKYPARMSKLTITNSFGVPSKDPDVWQKDVKKALTYQKDGQLLILSFMGTKREGYTKTDFINDYVRAAVLAKETKAPVLEVNLSCPNIGKEGLVCYDPEISLEICKGVRKKIGNIPLLIKLGYFQSTQEKMLEKMIGQLAKYIDGICTINTMQMKVVDKFGKQGLPGVGRLLSGVCGSYVKKSGVDMVKRLCRMREKNSYDFIIIGVGGVMTPADYFEYKKLGVDAVQSATGAMFNPRLAVELKEKLK